MPVLKNSRHEVFAQIVARGASQTDAYRRVYGKDDDANASRLTGNDRVRARIEELKTIAADRAAKAMAKTKADIVAQLDEAIDLSREIRQPASMVTASLGQAKILGHITDRHLVGVRRIEDMTEDELLVLAGEKGNG